MRKARTSTLIGALIILAVMVAAVAAGCGTATQAASQGAAAPTTAEGILAQAASSAQNLTSATGQFNLSVAVASDASKLPASEAALLAQPITLSGTFAFNEKPQAVDASLTASIAGQNLALGIKAADKKAWVQFMGQWYDLPADTAQTGSTETTLSEANKNAIMQAIKAAGVDPVTWLTGLKIVGDETIDGTATTHLQGTVDFNKVMADIAKLMQDKTLQGMMGSLGSKMMGSTSSTLAGGAGTTLAGGTGASVSIPSAQDLQAVQSQLAAMFKNLTIDVWIAKDSYQLRQTEINATIVPPAGQSTQGVNSVTLKFTLSMAPATTPLTVTPPADVKPFSDLQTAISGLTKLFSGMMGGAESTSTTTGQ